MFSELITAIVSSSITAITTFYVTRHKVYKKLQQANYEHKRNVYETLVSFSVESSLLIYGKPLQFLSAVNTATAVACPDNAKLLIDFYNLLNIATEDDISILNEKFEKCKLALNIELFNDSRKLYPKRKRKSTKEHN